MQFDTAGANGNNSNYDLDKSAEKVASALDNEGLSRQAIEFLFQDEYKKAEENGLKNEFVKSVDEKETDDKGIDLVVKYDTNKNPIDFQIVPGEWHANARKMAELMDTRQQSQAMQLNYDMSSKIREEFPGFSNIIERNRQRNRWGFTVDYYEKSGVGYDVNIYKWPGSKTGEPGFDFLKLWFKDKP